MMDRGHTHPLDGALHDGCPECGRIAEATGKARPAAPTPHRSAHEPTQPPQLPARPVQPLRLYDWLLVAAGNGGAIHAMPLIDDRPVGLTECGRKMPRYPDRRLFDIDDPDVCRACRRRIDRARTRGIIDVTH